MDARSDRSAAAWLFTDETVVSVQIGSDQAALDAKGFAAAVPALLRLVAEALARRLREDPRH